MYYCVFLAFMMLMEPGVEQSNSSQDTDIKISVASDADGLSATLELGGATTVVRDEGGGWFRIKTELIPGKPSSYRTKGTIDPQGKSASVTFDLGHASTQEQKGGPFWMCSVKAPLERSGSRASVLEATCK